MNTHPDQEHPHLASGALHPLATRLNEDILQCVAIILSQPNDSNPNRHLDMVLQEWMRRFVADVKAAKHLLVSHGDDAGARAKDTQTTVVMSRRDALRKEISDLQRDLKAKDELIQKHVSKLREFQDKMDQLLEMRDLLQRVPTPSNIKTQPPGSGVTDDGHR